MARVAALQTANWQRDERIAHLEQGSAAMAQDVMSKAAIIQHYCVAGEGCTEGRSFVNQK